MKDFEGFIGGTFQALSEHMNATKKFAIVMTGISSLATLTLIAGPPLISVQVPAPVISVQVPVPTVTVEATVPDTYVWDGVEFVGVVGSQYYYLGPNNVWLPFDAVRVARFHDWERLHADWRAHAIRNELYRHDIHGHVVPFHDDHGHDMNHDNGHDHDVNH
jgi:hypothetical protein